MPYGNSLSLAFESGFAERLEREYHSVDEEQASHLPLPGPTAAEIKELIQASFWASLTKEEGNLHDLRIVFMPVDESEESHFIFREPLEFEPKKLAKITPALLPSFRVGAWRAKDSEELVIWGFAPSSRGWAFVS